MIVHWVMCRFESAPKLCDFALLLHCFDILLKLCNFVLVFVHELGHFLAARSVGARVEKFYIGFNPWGFGKVLYQGKETEYGIGFLPLGGYCKIAGMVDESLDSKDSDNEPKDNEFRSKNTFQKLWILSAGVIMNFLLAIFIPNKS